MSVVMLVDDERRVTDGLRRALRKVPWDIVTANSADEADAILATREVDVIVSDERMPHRAGSAFLADVRRQHPTTMRILLTGHASPDATVRAVNEANVFRFLTKPCAPALLAATVDEALQAQVEVRRQVAAASAEVAEAAALDRAIAGLRLVVQPIVGTDADGARAVRAWEALARTSEPTLANPSTLFDVAGRRGRLWEVERRVRAAAAEIVPRVPAGGLLFCNIEAQSLEDPDLYAPDAPLTQVADRVVLEITERGVIADLDACMRAVGRLRGLGFRIAIDDFGAGYAGLGTFGAVEPDIVKFDMDLVRHIDRSPTQARVIGSMLALCRELGIRTVAEGVESAAERDTLERLGFDLLQGYWFARPAPPFADVRLAD